MDKKTKFPLFAIIMMVVGVGLILFGIIAPSKIFSDNNTYTVELDRSGIQNMKLKVTLNTDENIDTTVLAYIDEDEFEVSVKEIEKGVYKGSTEIDRDEYFMTSNDDVVVKVRNISGETLAFEYYDEFSTDSGKIIATIIPIFFGVFITLMGLVIGLTIKNRNNIKKAFNSTVNTVAGAVGTIKEAIKPTQKETEKYCDYCGCFNDLKEQKCVHCGAPLKKKQM